MTMLQKAEEWGSFNGPATFHPENARWVAAGVAGAMRIARRMRWFYMAFFEKTSSSLFVTLERRVVFEKTAKSATITNS